MLLSQRRLDINFYERLRPSPTYKGRTWEWEEQVSPYVLNEL